MIALALEGFALTHAEAMLLVDDDDAEALKLHRIFNKRVGADNALDAAVGKSGEDVFFVTLFHLAGEQRNAHAKRRKCARTSVVAMSAAWCPLETAVSMA